MGKSDLPNNGMKDMSPQTEASKLLEAALMQMDGIISGNTGSISAHSPDYGFSSSPPGVREAANGLVTALQNCPAPPQPDPHITKALLVWIQNSGLQNSDSEHFLKLYFQDSKVRDGISAIDLGCADGRFLKNTLVQYLGRFEKVVGVDISEPMIRHARQNNINENVEYEVMDIATEKLPQKFVNCFDYAFSFYTFMWLENKHQQALRNIYKMLKPKGEIFFVFVAGHPFYTFLYTVGCYKKYAAYTRGVREKMFPIYHYYPNKKDWYESLLKEAGFKIRYCEVVDRNYPFNTSDMFIDALKAINPYNFPQELVDPFFQDTLEMAKKFSGNKEGDDVISFHHEIFVVSATKS